MTRYIKSMIVGDLTINDPKSSEGLGINVTLKSGVAVDLHSLGFDDSAIRKSQKLKKTIDRLQWVKVLSEKEYIEALAKAESVIGKPISQPVAISGVDEENMFDDALRELENKEEAKNAKTEVSKTSRLTKSKKE